MGRTRRDTTLTADTLTVFVPVRLVNPLNTREHWAKRWDRSSRQREAVAMAVWSALRDPRNSMIVEQVTPNTMGTRLHWRITAKPTTPKRITLVGHVARKFDTDGLQAAMKSVRDGLQDCGLIHTDGPDSGHTFTYDQVVKKPLGVTITVAMA